MPLEQLQDTNSSTTIAPHLSSSYPDYLSPVWDEDTQRAVVWHRLREHRKLASHSLRQINERYKALRQEQQTQAESSHEPSSRDIYRLLNGAQDIMRQPFSRVMLFLIFIKGPDIQEWASSQVGWLGSRLLAGARRNEEHLYDTVLDSFNMAFTDTMSLQKAKAEFHTLKMEKGELDMYIAKFKRLARLAGYNLQDQMVLDRFGSGLNSGLFTAIINNTDPRTWLDWTRAAQKYQQKYLLICSALGLKTGNPNSKTRKKLQTPEQWKAAWNKRSGDPDAMDTTPGRARARRIDAEEQTELMKAGKCFTCKKQGHLSRDCPQRPPQRPWTNARASTSAQIKEVNSKDEEPAKVRSGKKKHSASEIMDILREADEEAKDSIIQEFFMKEDF